MICHLQLLWASYGFEFCSNVSSLPWKLLWRRFIGFATRCNIIKRQRIWHADSVLLHAASKRAPISNIVYITNSYFGGKESISKFLTLFPTHCDSTNENRNRMLIREHDKIVTIARRISAGSFKTSGHQIKAIATFYS